MSRWLAALALKLLPAEDRARFGDDLCRDWCAMSREARQRGGRWAAWRYGWREGLAFLRLAGQRRSRHASSPPWQGLGGDLRSALRRWRLRPLRALAGTALLAVALTAPLIAFAMADAVLWRPLPFPDADRLVVVWERSGPLEAPEPSRVTDARFVDWSTRSTVFDGLAAFRAAGFQVEQDRDVSTVRGVRVTGNFFAVLGVTPALGRLIEPRDQAAGAPPVVVLSHTFWTTRMGASTDVLGRTLRLSNTPYTIVGVLPDVWLPSWPVNPATIELDASLRQVWVPMAPASVMAGNARSHLLGGIGRLAPGQTVASAMHQLETLTAAEHPDPHGGVVRPLRSQMVTQARTPLILLLAAACVVLLVAALNLAALELASFESRVTEFRVRSALGAGRWTLARQLLLETTPMVMAALVIALLVAHVGLLKVAGRVSEQVPLLTPPSLDASALLVGCGLAAVTVLLMVAWPVWRAQSLGRRPLHSTQRVATGPRAFRALIVGQLAGAVALVLAATVLVQAFVDVTTRDPGFDPEGVQVMEISLPRDRHRDPATIVATERRLMDALRGVPGMTAVTLSHDHPFAANWLDVVSVVGDAPAGRDDTRAQVQLRIVEPGYVDVMRVRLLDGRTFDAGLEPGDDGQVLVNEAFVAGHAAGVGRRVVLSSPVGTWGDGVPASFEIVGVIGDERFRGLDQPSEPAVYVSTRQFPQTDVTVVARFTDGEPRLDDLRHRIRGVEPAASLGMSAPLRSLEAEERLPRTLLTVLVSGFASATLLLAAVGLSVMLLLVVAARTREIGIRVALGADRRVIVAGVVRDAAGPVAMGLVVGITVAVLAERVFRARLTDVPATALEPVLLVAAVMTVTMAAAAAWPARRASAVDPAECLRRTE